MMEYRFKPISKTCAGTGQPLAPGSVCYSVLVERLGRYERLDFSPAGWKGLPDDALGFWRCTVPVPETRRAATADAEVLMQQFEQLLESSNPRDSQLAYVLALYLLQRRRLKLEGTRLDDDAEYLELAGARGEGPYEIRNQELSEEQLTELRQALDQQLTLGWEAA
jgi:hypothetical protein